MGPQSGGQNPQWPTSGPRGYMTVAVEGILDALERGTKSAVAHKWAQWLHNPCRLGDPRCFGARDKIGSGPHVGPMAI